MANGCKKPEKMSAMAEQTLEIMENIASWRKSGTLVGNSLKSDSDYMNGYIHAMNEVGKIDDVDMTYLNCRRWEIFKEE